MLSLYISKSTWLHKVPASVKLTSLAAFSMVLLPSQSLWLLGTTSLLASVAYLSLTKPGLIRLKKVAQSAGLFALVVGVFQFMVALLGGIQADVWISDLRTAASAAMVSALRLLSLLLLADLVTITTPLQNMVSVIEFVLVRLQRFGIHARRVSLQVGLVIRLGAMLRGRLATVTEAFAVKHCRKPGLLIIAPVTRQMLQTGASLAEALQARALRRPKP